MVNGMCYIGQTQKPLKYRWREHVRDSEIKDFKLYRAIRKYGVDAFKVDTIEKVNTTEELNRQEKYWVDYFDSFNNGYNSTLGGEDNPMNHEENRRKISITNKGMKNFLGKTHTSETKARMSKSATGRIRSEEDKLKQSITRKEKGMGAKKGIEHPCSVQVNQLDIKTGKVIRTFPTVSDAEIYFRGKITSAIHRVLNDNYCNVTAYGYKWEAVS